VTALPFTVIMVFLAWGIYREMSADVQGLVSTNVADDETSIALRLQRILMPSQRKAVDARLVDTTEPALADVRDALLAEGIDAQVLREKEGVVLQAKGAGDNVFIYRVRVTSRPLAAFSLLDATEGRRAL